jgi:hypothetical protein
LRRSPARRGLSELKVDRHADPPYAVNIRAGNVRNDQGWAGSRGMQCSTLIRFTGIAYLSRVQPFGLPRNDGT